MMTSSQCALCACTRCRSVHLTILQHSPLPSACGPAALSAPTEDVVHAGALPASLAVSCGQQASKRGGCPPFELKAVMALVRVVGLLIDEAGPIHVQHQEPDEMVVQITSIEDLRWAVIAAEQELAGIGLISGDTNGEESHG